MFSQPQGIFMVVGQPLKEVQHVVFYPFHGEGEQQERYLVSSGILSHNYSSLGTACRRCVCTRVSGFGHGKRVILIYPAVPSTVYTLPHNIYSACGRATSWFAVASLLAVCQNFPLS